MERFCNSNVQTFLNLRNLRTFERFWKDSYYLCFLAKMQNKDKMNFSYNV